jgi:dsRNA-specific ribonuclease
MREVKEEKTKVSLKITLNKETYHYVGKGENIKAAKRAAAKYALRHLNYNEFVI